MTQISDDFSSQQMPAYTEIQHNTQEITTLQQYTPVSPPAAGSQLVS